MENRPPYNCNLSQEYPPVHLTKKNIPCAKILLTPMSGPDSELGASIGYTYQSTVLAETYPQVAQLLECIAKTEMHHYRILSDMIWQLGVEPRAGYFHRDHFRYFSTDRMNWSTELTEMLHADRTDELAAAKKYEQLSQEIRQPDISRMLHRISLDEEHHAALLEDMLKHIG